ncbi:MAG TPA: hypothetical protein VK453_19140 [Micromonosporaceae bacterium]|nr:hypothetical protein [Micromonosporaceae bacterium]
MTWWQSSAVRRWAGWAGAAMVLAASAVAGPSAAMADGCATTGNFLHRVTGDWDGDGDDTIGLYNQWTATWYLRNTNTAGAPDLCFRYGVPGDLPVVGDWDGNGADTVGVARVSHAVNTWLWVLSNRNASGGGDVIFHYGLHAVVVQGAHTRSEPITGDWDGDGDTNIGVTETGQTHRRWHLREVNSAGADTLAFMYGRSWRGPDSDVDLPPDSPVVGDWDGNGTDTVGIIRWSDDEPEDWHLRNTNTPGNPDIAFRFGDLPSNGNSRTHYAGHMVVGDWNGSGSGDGPGHVQWLNRDDPATPHREFIAQWALRERPSAGLPSKVFQYGEALYGVPTPSLPDF